MTPSFLSYADGFSQLTDGNLDAAFALSGFPAGAVIQAPATNDLRFISFSDGMLDKALASNRAYVRSRSRRMSAAPARRPRRCPCALPT